MKTKRLILLLPLLLTGCLSPKGIASVVTALSKDTNSVQISVTTVWGTVSVTRNTQRVLMP